MEPINDKSLFGLDINELDAVGEDIELYYKGYKFYYAVDAYDLVHFFFPYLDTLQFKEGNVHKLALEGIAYDTFFSDTNTGAILLLEEYKEELALVRDVFLDKMERAYELTHNIEQLTREFQHLKDKGKKLEEIVFSNPDLCFLLLVFLQRQEELKELNFIKFFKKKVYINSFGTNDDEFNICADEAFSRPYDRDFVTTIYDRFKKIQDKKLPANMHDDDREKYYYNSLNDIIAIEKILTANKTITAHEKYKDTVFYYLSSTPTKSRVIFKLINDTYAEEMPNREHFKSGCSVHRNVVQVFLFTLLITGYSTMEMPVKLLALIKNYRKGLGSLQMQTGENDPEVMSALNTLLKKMTSNIQNHLLSSIFRNYQDTLDGIARDGNKRVESFTKEVLEKFEKIQLEQNNDEAYLEYSITKHGQLLLLEQAVTNEQDPKIMVTIRRGKDIVRLNYHHLPFLLFMYDREDRKKHAAYYSAMKAISEIVSDSITYIQPIIAFLKDFFVWWQKKDIRERTQELLMSIYIDLLSIRISGDSKETDIEVSLITVLEHRAFMLGELLKKDSKSHLKSLRNEIYYVLIWLYRRTLKFDELVKLENEIIDEDTWDMRLFHGVGMAYESLWYYKGKQPEDKGLLEKSITYLIKAVEGYEDFLAKMPPGHIDNIRNLVVKSIIGIGNSNCDSLLRLYDIDGDAENILRARKLLSNMKDYSEELELDYDGVPIINHTEADLEYYEALLLFQKKEIPVAKKKINYAYRRFQRSIFRASFMSEESKGIGDRIEELRNKIYSYGSV
jgi:hypothetical protein